MARLPADSELSPHINAAARWLVIHQSGHLTERQQAQFSRWLAEDHKNRTAWDNAQRLAGMFHNVPVELSRNVLGRKQKSKRTFIKALAGLVVVPTAGYWWLNSGQQTAAYPSIATVHGEQRELLLSDGSRLKLNTNSEVAIDYSEQQRRLLLVRGEIMVETAPDALYREFWVSSKHGSVMALGTRFTVSQTDHETRIAVLEHAVRIHPERHHEYLELGAGDTVSFSEHSLGQPETNALAASAWTRGQIVVEDQRLDEFVSELERYYRGVIRLDPVSAQLRISGVYQLNNIEAIFDTLQQTLPVQVDRPRAGWVMISRR